MKNNRKNRKLKFIREKNKLRLGFDKFKAFVKVPENVSDIIIKYAIEDLVCFAKRYLFKKHKLSLNIIEIQTGQDNEDFIRNLKTIVATLRNKIQINYGNKKRKTLLRH